MGTNEPEIGADGEGPERWLMLPSFAMEASTVTNSRFAEFVQATGYVTETERLGWSLVFHGGQARVEAAVRAGSQLPWWHKVEEVSWRHPEGPGSSIDDRMDHPVVQVSWNDANAFARWVGGRLPSELEWEHAARGGAVRRRFPWGNAEPDDQTVFCNTWQGLNTQRDGYARTAPARSFEPNVLGFYSMCGNVWEWTCDPFRVRSVSYCYRYRIAARTGMSPESTGSNVGFRVAYDLSARDQM